MSLGLLGCLAGFALSFGILSGDAQGQVNLLFLLLLFVVLPLLALLLSLFLLVRRGGRGVVGWVLELPVWPADFRQQYLQRDLIGDRKAWLVYQTQFLSLGFSLGSLFLYLLLLLATDISFIWRSTLLEAEQLLPLLDAIALPWRFWSEAQASLELLEQTRDFRLLPADQSAYVVGLWWRYVLAAQICYSLLPRTLLLLLAWVALHRSRAVNSSAEPAADPIKPGRVTPTLAELISEMPEQARVLDWAGMPGKVREAMNTWLHVSGGFHTIRADSAYSTLDPVDEQVAIVVVVKAWEPPLAELADFLATIPAGSNRLRLLLPLDWNQHSLQKVKAAHLNEWRRFAATLPGWKVVQVDHSATRTGEQQS